MAGEQFGFPGPSGQSERPRSEKVVGKGSTTPPWLADILERYNPFHSRKLRIAAVVVVVLLLAVSSFLVYVGPDQYGIKVVKIGANRGVHKEIYDVGYHFIIPFGFEEMHTMPRSFQVLELTNSPETAAGLAMREKPAHIQTSDGFFVDVDVSILYHIEDPHKVFTSIGPGTLYISNGIVPKAEPVLKETLGELTTEEFYNSPLRVAKTQIAKDKLNNELVSKGIRIDQVLVRYFMYSPEIQNIEDKKLKDQLVFKNQAEARAATEGAFLKKVQQEGEMNVKVKLSEGQAYVTKRAAEKELYARKMRARADLLVRLAEAKKAELRNAALQGAGSDRMVGLRMAQALRGLDTVVLPSDGPSGVNPLDMHRILTLFEVREAAARPAAQGGAR